MKYALLMITAHVCNALVIVISSSTTLKDVLMELSTRNVGNGVQRIDIRRDRVLDDMIRETGKKKVSTVTLLILKCGLLASVGRIMVDSRENHGVCYPKKSNLSYVLGYHLTWCLVLILLSYRYVIMQYCSINYIYIMRLKVSCSKMSCTTDQFNVHFDLCVSMVVLHSWVLQLPICQSSIRCRSWLKELVVGCFLRFSLAVLLVLLGFLK